MLRIIDHSVDIVRNAERAAHGTHLRCATPHVTPKEMTPTTHTPATNPVQETSLLDLSTRAPHFVAASTMNNATSPSRDRNVSNPHPDKHTRPPTTDHKPQTYKQQTTDKHNRPQTLRYTTPTPHNETIPKRTPHRMRGRSPSLIYGTRDRRPHPTPRCRARSSLPLHELAVARISRACKTHADCERTSSACKMSP